MLYYRQSDSWWRFWGRFVRMRYYIELTLIPDPETPLYFLWEKIYQQLHLALVTIKDKADRVAIGVDFPNYSFDEEKKNFHLGNKLRLFAKTSDEFEKLNLSQWLARLTDYVHTTSIRIIPEKVNGYAYFLRFQPKSSNERLARRRSNKLKIEYSEALKFFEDTENRKLSYKCVSSFPYINMRSATYDKYFKLFVQKQDTQQSQNGSFSCYGLSKNATVPLF